ncbi:hypothetical protein PHET_10882 [Paragonimus heterotremus]|uniref:Roadblock/LAMTOR2 domain-containing protein n=1 Tax=Paragonimus heterotremus TaxID=100268 RepID=A0A8J4SFX2_9TREM|nr:hypothetical protein PHET_10882 [Paragonimus heterotremus]
MDNSTTVQYCGLIQQLTAKARSAVRDLDPSNDLTFLRIRSKKNEIMVAPGLTIRTFMGSLIAVVQIISSRLVAFIAGMLARRLKSVALVVAQSTGVLLEPFDDNVEREHFMTNCLRKITTPRF